MVLQMPERPKRNAAQPGEKSSAGGRKQTKAEARKAADLANAARIIDGEDPAEYQARLDAWMADYPPRNLAEEQLIRYAVDLSWKLDRAERQDNEVLHERVLDAISSCEGENAEALTQAATLASFDPSVDGERRRKRYFALSRDFLRVVDLISRLRR